MRKGKANYRSYFYNEYIIRDNHLVTFADDINNKVMAFKQY